MVNMYEVLLGDYEVVRFKSFEYDLAYSMFNFYGKDKDLFGLPFVILMNAEEGFYLEA